MSELPWYRRSEFWASLAATVLGTVLTKHPNPTVQAIGSVIAGAAPINYSFGRASVKRARSLPTPVNPVIATTGVAE